MRVAPKTIPLDEWMQRVDTYNIETNFNVNYQDVQSKRDPETNMIIPGKNNSMFRNDLFRLYNDYFIPYEAPCHCEGKINLIYPKVMNYYNEIKNINNND